MSKGIVMEYSKKFQLVKDYYDCGLWTEDMVRNAVGRWITKLEEEEIVRGEVSGVS